MLVIMFQYIPAQLLHAPFISLKFSINPIIFFPSSEFLSLILADLLSRLFWSWVYSIAQIASYPFPFSKPEIKFLILSASKMSHKNLEVLKILKD